MFTPVPSLNGLGCGPRNSTGFGVHQWVRGGAGHSYWTVAAYMGNTTQSPVRGLVVPYSIRFSSLAIPHWVSLWTSLNDAKI